MEDQPLPCMSLCSADLRHISMWPVQIADLSAASEMRSSYGSERRPYASSGMGMGMGNGFSGAWLPSPLFWTMLTTYRSPRWLSSSRTTPPTNATSIYCSPRQSLVRRNFRRCRRILQRLPSHKCTYCGRQARQKTQRLWLRRIRNIGRLEDSSVAE